MHAALTPRGTRLGTLAITVGALALLSLPAGAQDGTTIPESWLEAMRWRSVGPANMGGRCIDVAVSQQDSSLWWVATASGGLLKTANNGISFEHQFDHEGTVSLGDVTVAPSDDSIVWVGTGENNPRNSVSYGNGVYKSMDGGETWSHMGLENTFQTGRILIHPENPDIVYVGALGRLYGPNEDRGLYKTTDGGETWAHILYIDDKTGVMDMRMKPDDPETLIVATYERQRDGFDTNDPAKKWGPGGGIHKTTDGGTTFKRLTEGLPTCQIGRVGLDWYESDPNVVFAVIETERIGQTTQYRVYFGIEGEDADAGARLTNVVEEGPAAAAGLQTGDIVLRVNDHAVLSYQELLDAVRAHEPGDTITLEISREREAQSIEVELGERDPEQGNQRPFGASLGGQRENIQDQQGPEGFEFGGIYRSDDAGESWTRINSCNPRPMYYSQIRVDPSDDQYVYVLGTSLYRSSDGGTTFSGDGGRGGVHVDHHGLWIDPADGRHMVLANDGGIYVTWDRMNRWDHHNHMAIGQFYHVTVGPRRDYWVYGGLQDNGSWGAPNRGDNGSGALNEHWISIGGGDGFVCRVDAEDPNQIYSESQNGAMGRIHLETGERGSARPGRGGGGRGGQAGGQRYRFNWKTPFILSHHNSKIHYSAGNHVFRSLNRGDNAQPISPDITASERGSGTALSESPRDELVLYVGTDDGALWRTQSGGHEWEDLFEITQEDIDAAAAEAASDENEEGGGGRPAPAASERRAGGGGFAGRGGAGGGNRGQQMIQRFDANGDGKLQKSEVPDQMAEFFDRMDANGDGVLTAEEIGAGFGGRGGGAAGQPQARQGQPQARQQGQPQGRGQARGARRGGGLVGTWKASIDAPEIPEEARAFTLTIARDDEGQLTVKLASQMMSGEGESVEFSRENNRLTFTVEGPQGPANFTATIEGARMSGEIEAGDGMFSVGFSAEREGGGAAPAAAAPQQRSGRRRPAQAEPQEQATGPDPISGRWVARIQSDEIPEGQDEFEYTLKLGEEGAVTGSISTQFSEGDISGGKFDAESGKLTFSFASDQFTIGFTATVKDNAMSGSGDVEGGMFTFDFTATRSQPARAGGGRAPRAEAPEQAAPEYDWKPINDLMPGRRWVSSLEASRFENGRVYVAFDAHRSDDDNPYIFVSEDYGTSWRSLGDGLPEGAGVSRVLREDLQNPNVLWLGTEFAAWVSIDRGTSWTKLSNNTNLPTVAIHELAQHPEAGEIVAATHGRSLWILDVTTLRQITPDVLEADTHLFKPNNPVYWRNGMRTGGTLRRFVGQNPSTSANIFYVVGAGAENVSLVVTNSAGETVRELEGSTDAGLHRAAWDLRLAAPQAQGQQRRGGGRGGFQRRGRLAPAGTYTVTLDVDGQSVSQTFEVQTDPEDPTYRPWETEKEELEWEELMGGDEEGERETGTSSIF